jgi:hypothetical protein
VDWDGYRLVLDLGYATLPRLLAQWRDGGVDAVAITHEHPDHCIDLHALFRMRFYGGAGRPRLPLYCPPGVLDRLEGIEPDVDLAAVFDVHPLPGAYRAGPLELIGLPLPHFVPNAGIRLQTDEIALAYSGDTGPDPLLAELGRDADVRRGRPLGRKGWRAPAHAHPFLARQRPRRRSSGRVRRIRRGGIGSRRGPHREARISCEIAWTRHANSSRSGQCR